MILKYATRDIYLAAWLRYSGMAFLGAHRNEKERFIFIFQDEINRRILVKCFFEDTAKMSPRVLGEQVRDLRRMIRDNKQDPPAI